MKQKNNKKQKKKTKQQNIKTGKTKKIRRKYVGDSHKKRMSPSKMHTERKWLKAEREKEI